MNPLPSRLTPKQYLEGIRAGDRVVLGKAITLVESQRTDDRALANELIERILPFTGNSFRLGITGVPGVGKSTFMEKFGFLLLEAGHSVAILAIDPSSSITGGSILGDKTRMENLARSPQVFIRPSPSGIQTGGVAAHTREALLLCEAAGFTFVIIETVGVGQSETLVREMVDFFMLLLLAGGGDELQGIKRGIMELADGLVFTKADSPAAVMIGQNIAELRTALHLIPAFTPGWHPEVLACSGITGEGLAEVYELLQRFQSAGKSSGSWANLRRQQLIQWMESDFRNRILELAATPHFTEFRNNLARQVTALEISPSKAADILIEKYIHQITTNNVK